MRIARLATSLLATSFATAATAQINQLSNGTRPSATPANLPAGWITPADYPPTLAAPPEKGVSAWLSTNAKGLVTACEVTYGSGIAAIDALTCKLLSERARFKTGSAYPFGAVVDWPLIAALAPPPAGRLRGPVPLTPPGEWIGSDDYPLTTDSAGAPDYVEAGVTFRLQVDTAGKVTGCTTVSRNKDADKIEKAACQALSRRAAFDPARDPSGQPVTGVYRGNAFFLRAGRSCSPFSAFCSDPVDQTYKYAQMPTGWQSVTFLADVLVGPDGKTLNCSVRSITGAMTFPAPGERRASVLPLAGAVCNNVVQSWTARPAQDAAGNAVVSAQSMRIVVRLPELPAPPPPPAIRPAPNRRK